MHLFNSNKLLFELVFEYKYSPYHPAKNTLEINYKNSYERYEKEFDVYTKYPKIASFFKRTAHSFNGINQTFVASVEAYDYPVYGVQYHPEKNQFELKNRFFIFVLLILTGNN